MTHLFGDGWEQRYASDLRTYLNGLREANSVVDFRGPIWSFPRRREGGANLSIDATIDHTAFCLNHL